MTVIVSTPIQKKNVIISTVGNFTNVRVISSIPSGLRVQISGTAGLRGEKGDKGDSGGNYTHPQVTPSSLWVIEHNLGYKPGGIMAFDTAGSRWEGDVNHLDDNNLTIYYGIASFAGVAYLS